MKFSYYTLLVLLIPIVFSSCNNKVTFDSLFYDNGLRVDFILEGDSSFQVAKLESIFEEPIWSGPRKNLIEPFDYGDYKIVVKDSKSEAEIYSRSFNSLFREWRTTDEARHEKQAWINTIVVPHPKGVASISIYERRLSDMQFYPLLSFNIDKDAIRKQQKISSDNLLSLLDNGNHNEKVDFVFISEGYGYDERAKFEEDAIRFKDKLLSTSPFKEQASDFNIRAVFSPSKESGVTMPHHNVFKETVLGSTYNTFEVERYLTTRNVSTIRDCVSGIPCDAVIVLVNSEEYGGSGLYNLYAMGSASNSRTLDVFIHELGHSFAGLADEYFSSSVSYSDFYNLSLEPWESNITTLYDFDSKWRDLIGDSIPVPTPAVESFYGRIGVFEGAAYINKGMYRPSMHCMMNDLTAFCPVCETAIKKMIDYFCDREVK